MTPEKVTVAWSIAAALGVVLLLSLFIPIKSGPHGISPESRAGKVDFKEEFPPSLSSLFPDYIDIEDCFFATDGNGAPHYL
ncbi:MAG: hypothetical protein P1U86_18515 [Verrucomicrobiales bacterium]|nr:hypothetical protein [Verrucomicrobiales bacterium]